MGNKVSRPPIPVELVTQKNGNTLGDSSNPVIIDGKTIDTDVDSRILDTNELLIEILQHLKAIVYHLNLATDANIKDVWEI
jgi:hypothetical protein